MKNLKKIFACLLAVAMLASLLLLPCVNAEEPVAETEWVNILDLDSVETQYGSGKGDYINADEGAIHLALWEGTAYQYGLLIDGVQSKFRLSGEITIEDVIATADDDISIWNGLRIICGRTDFLNYNTISMYRKVGMQIVNHSTVGIGAIIPYSDGFVFEPGREFSFEIIKEGHRLIFKVDGNVIIDHTLAENEDFFTVDAYDNIGFIAINTEYTIRNFKVEVDAATAPTPKPTEVPEEKTAAPTEQADKTEQPAEKTAAPTEKTLTTERPEDTNTKNKTDNSWIWLVMEIAVAVIVISVIAILVTKKKKA